MSVKLSEKVVVSNLKPGNGRVICNCDVEIAGWITIRDMRLYRGKDNLVQLGAPYRSYTDQDGQTKYWDHVKLSEQASLGVRMAITDKAVEAKLLPPDGGVVRSFQPGVTGRGEREEQSAFKNEREPVDPGNVNPFL